MSAELLHVGIVISKASWSKWSPILSDHEVKKLCGRIGSVRWMMTAREVVERKQRRPESGSSRRKDIVRAV